MKDVTRRRDASTLDTLTVPSFLEPRPSMLRSRPSQDMIHPNQPFGSGIDLFLSH